MDQYKNFELEDFIWDSYFRKWILYPTLETDERWNSWLKENPDKKELVNQAAGIVKAVAPEIIPLNEKEKQLAVSTIISKLDEHVSQNVQRSAIRFPAYWLNAAAVIVLLAGLSWIVWTRNQHRQVDYIQLVADAAEPLIEKVNTSNKPLLISLHDGSKVILSPNGRISFPATSTLKREVYLSGEAFFDISKDPSKPFFVYANEVVTKVLGTSFRVRSYAAEKEVSVSVKTGKVSVYTRQDTDAMQKQASSELSGIVIAPNQQIVVTRESVKMTKSLVHSPEIVTKSIANYNFEFDDAPASEVFATLRQAYGIEIIYDKDSMNDCPVTARLTDLPLYEKLDLVCKAINATYERMDASILIQGKGCGQSVKP